MLRNFENYVRKLTINQYSLEQPPKKCEQPVQTGYGKVRLICVSCDCIFERGLCVYFYSFQRRYFVLKNKIAPSLLTFK